MASRPERGALYIRITPDQYRALEAAEISFLGDFHPGRDGYWYALMDDIDFEESAILLEFDIDTEGYDYIYSTWAPGNL